MTPFGIRKKLKKAVKRALGMDAPAPAPRPVTSSPSHPPPSEAKAPEAPPTPSIGAGGQAKSKSGAKSKSPAKSKSGAKPKSPAKSKSKSPAKSKSKSPAKPKPKSKSPAKPKPKSKAPAKPKSKSPAKPKSKSKSKSPAKPKSKAKSQSKARELGSDDVGKMWVQIAGLKPDELVPGAVRRTEIFGTKIALYKVDDAVFATPDSCPHAAGPLSDGVLEGSVISCPFHAFEFDVRDGTCVSGQPFELDVLGVKVKDERVLVEVSS